MMTTESTYRVNSLLLSLIDHLVPSLKEFPDDGSSSEENEAKLKRREQLLVYTQEILASSFFPTLPRSDLDYLCNYIKKRLLKEDKSGDKAIKFGQLVNQFIKMNELSHQWEILYFLYQSSLHHCYSVYQYEKPPLIGIKTSQNETTTTQAKNKLIIQNETPTKAKCKTKGTLGEYEKHMLQYGYLQEDLIVLELLFILQGSGNNSQYFRYDPLTKTYLISPYVKILNGWKSMIIHCCKSAIIVKNLSDWIEGTKQEKKGILIKLALMDWMQGFLDGYYKKIAQLKGFTWNGNDVKDTEEQIHWIVPKGLGLRRIAILLKDSLYQLTFVQSLFKSFDGKGNLEVIEMAYQSLSHGDPSLKALSQSLIKKLITPIMYYIEDWIYDGILREDASEFFICVQETDSGNPLSEDLIWEKKFKLEQSLLPYFVRDNDGSGKLANRIFVVGKSLWFMKNICELSLGEYELSSSFPLTKDPSLMYELSQGKTEKFNNAIQGIYTLVAPLLLQHLRSENIGLDEHLQGLKRYLLCERGDFIEGLMDSLGSELNKPATHLYRHHLIGTLDEVMRRCLMNSRQDEEKETLRRLDVRLLKPSKNESGWEVFTLDYHVKIPLNNCFNVEVMASYLKIFRFLWRFKRCEACLSGAWRSLSTFRRVLSTSADLKDLTGEVHFSCTNLVFLLAFIQQFLHYAVLDVIEVAWKQFWIDKRHRQLDLDEFIQCHDDYLNFIILHATFSQKNADVNSNIRTLQLKIYQILQIILSYVKYQTTLIKEWNDWFGSVKSRQSEIHQRSKAGNWGSDSKSTKAFDLLKEESNRRRAIILSEMNKLVQQFKVELKKFLEFLNESTQERPTLNHLIILIEGIMPQMEKNIL